jgi:hypothetical protein
MKINLPPVADRMPTKPFLARGRVGGSYYLVTDSHIICLMTGVALSPGAIAPENILPIVGPVTLENQFK